MAGGPRERSRILYSLCHDRLWEVAHLLATRGVIAGFGDLTPDNRRIIAMEWIVEGGGACLHGRVCCRRNRDPAWRPVSSAVYAVATGTLIVLAVVSLFTGFKVAFLPFRLCPFILGISAASIAWGACL